ncbi:MAG: Hpt domain-containing protein [Anaerolineae bacterium]|nr:Hpt domain-containing protein [Anaerolineae bacterium]MDW8070574.1 Hpt domain-containing protein [Anaerolineae bacterium]
MAQNHTDTGDTTAPIWDRATALKRLDGDETLLAELMDMLLDQIETGITHLAEAIERGDARGVEQTAHTLKGASASLGAERFRQCAFQLEQLGRRGDLSDAADVLTRLREEAQLLRQAYRP